MRREVGLPPAFTDLQGKVNYVQKVTTNEYSSSCPSCGGSQHPNGELPDRFRMWVVSRHGKPLGWCRACGYIWTPTSERALNPDELEAWRKEQEAHEARRKASAERALALLQREKIWETYYQMLDDYSRSLWEKRGVSADFWQNYWQVGYDAAHVFPYEEKDGWHDWVTPTLTIPVWDVGWKCLNVKHRLLKPIEYNNGRQVKYRPERKGLPPLMFVCEPDAPLKGPTMIFEGEIKAMVAYSTMDNPKFQAVGIPTKTPGMDQIERLKNCDPVYILLDPDANVPTVSIRDGKIYNQPPASRRLAKMLGEERCFLIELPNKVDDMIVSYELDKEWMSSIIKMARKV
jgi:hypothetical protein